MLKVVEPTPGNYILSCELSGLNLSRKNEMGIFCNSPTCKCEQMSKKAKDKK